MKARQLLLLDQDYAALDKDQHSKHSVFSTSKAYREGFLRDNIARDEDSLRKTEALIVESGCSVPQKN